MPFSWGQLGSNAADYAKKKAQDKLNESIIGQAADTYNGLFANTGAPQIGTSIFGDAKKPAEFGSPETKVDPAILHSKGMDAMKPAESANFGETVAQNSFMPFTAEVNSNGKLADLAVAAAKAYITGGASLVTEGDTLKNLTKRKTQGQA